MVTVVNIDGSDGDNVLSLLAPRGVGETGIRQMVEEAHRSAGGDPDAMRQLLIRDGFTTPQHVTIDLPF